MSEAQLPVESYNSNFNEALGAYKGIDFRLLCKANPPTKGKTWIKSYKPKTAYSSSTETYIEQVPLTRSKSAAIDRRMWEAKSALQTYANDLTRRTPHQDVDFYMTAIEPTITETGHEFETLDELVESNDPTSITMGILANAFMVSRANTVLAGVTAATATRKKLDLDSTSSTFGTVVTASETWATNAPHNTLTTTNVGYFSFKDDAPLLRAMADSANVPDKEKLIMLINPHDAAAMCINSFDKMFSIDFVEKKHLEAGTLPEAFGISFVKSNLIPRGTMYAWLKEAVVWTPWKAMASNLALNPTYRFAPTFYGWESNNVARIDDLGVFKIAVQEESDD